MVMMLIIKLNKFDHDDDDLAVMVMMMILNELIMMMITDEIYNNAMRKPRLSEWEVVRPVWNCKNVPILSFVKVLIVSVFLEALLSGWRRNCFMRLFCRDRPRFWGRFWERISTPRLLKKVSLSNTLTLGSKAKVEKAVLYAIVELYPRPKMIMLIIDNYCQLTVHTLTTASNKLLLAILK